MSTRKVFTDSVTPLPEHGGLTPQGLAVNDARSEHRQDVMKLLFSLSLPAAAEAELEEKVERGENISADDLRKKYTAKAEDAEALVNWLKAHGFEILQVTPDRTSVYARATVAQIEDSLEVKMVRVTKNGLTYTAAQNAPSLPLDIGNGVQAIIGLQPFRQAQKHYRWRTPRNGNRVPRSAGGTAARAASTNVENAPPYLVSEVLGAYNAAGLPVTGKGQTIAILIDTVANDSDIADFWKRNNLPADLGRIEKINVTGVDLPPPEGEESLDEQWASGVAPGASIRVYASGSLSFVDLDMALDQILADLENHPGMRQVSISLGLGETFLGGPKGEVATQHKKFLKLAAAGVNVFVSSGDAGSNPDATGHSATGPTQAEYESSDPCVIGVGGTSLTLAPDGTVAEETGWPSSGGGKSLFFRRPSWQKGKGVPQGQRRLVPDVSLTADPENGGMVILNGSVKQFGGTSWSAPVWAGLCALINESRANAKKPFLGFLNPLIYPLIGTSAFRDIDTGSNGAFDAGPGYDLVTGIGVPNVKELIARIG